MLHGSCHCGAVEIHVPDAPEWLGSCNCSICRRLGTLFAYYPAEAGIRIEGETARYVWGDRMISLHHCPTCGCPTHWEPIVEGIDKVGINARLLDGFAIDGPRYLLNGDELEVRYLDNAG